MEVKSKIPEVEPAPTIGKLIVNAAHYPFEKMADVLVWAGVDPNHITVSKIPITLPVLGLHPSHPAAGVALFVIGSIADILDGKVARKTKKTSLEGAVLDSLVDKVVNAYMYLYIAAQLDWKNLPQDQFLIFLMALNAGIDVVSQRMRGPLWQQVRDSVRVVIDPSSAHLGENAQKANGFGKAKAWLQGLGVFSSLLMANQQLFQILAPVFFSASVFCAVKSIKGRSS